MIGGLQGDFGDLDNKYLKQNIPKYLKMSVENIRKLQKNTAALYIERKTLRASVIRRSGYVYPEKLKHPHLSSGCEISGCKMSAHEILDMKCPRAARLSGSTPSGFPQEDMRALLSCSRWMITYPIRIWCPDGKHWLKWASLATTHILPLSNGVSRRTVRKSFAMDSKELSLILDCFGDKKTIKTPKLNTISLELIARVLNMLIGLSPFLSSRP